MKKLIVLLAIAAAMGACSKSNDAPSAPAAPVAAMPAPDPAPTAAPAAAGAVAGADLPKECSDYLDKVSTCVGKQSGAAADAIRTSLDQTKASWNAMGADKSALGATCKTASDAFAAQAAAMKC